MVSAYAPVAFENGTRVAGTSRLPDPAAAPPAVLDAVRDEIEGLEAVLPWDISGIADRNPDGFVATDPATCRELAPGKEPESLRLEDALEALVTRFDLGLSILTADRAEQLRVDHAGIAALPRW